MKHSFRWAGYFLMVLTMAACGDNTAEDRKDGYTRGPVTKEDSLFKDVMDGHDVGMAKMGKLKGYSKQVENKLDSLEKWSSGKQDSVEKKLTRLQQNLRNAEAQMNRWMEEFKIDSAAEDIKRRLFYLESEKVRVNKVRDDILRALDEADSLLNRN